MPKQFGGTRFTKAAVPKLGGALNLTNRIIGSNRRKQKLTESPGTNPSKMGGGSLTEKSSSGYAQDSAPHKTLSGGFGVGGPGFDQINLKGFK